MCLSGLAWYFGRLSVRELATAFAGAAVFVGIVVAVSFKMPSLMHHTHSAVSHGLIVPQFLPTHSSMSERFVSLVGAWKLFVSHPIFGGGLGAYVSQKNMTADGIPLVIHSTELWLLAELGLVGFLVFAILGGYVWFTEWRVAGVDSAAAVVALCFLGFAVMSVPADMLYQRTFWLVVGAALAVPRLIPKSSIARQPEPASTGRT
ncbi:MAG: O-antigen ligase family protein [Pseudolabrys sp.]